MHSLNINHLRYFTAVCEYESVTKAAEVVHMSQPSITAAIKELEKAYGIKLFERTSKKITLTPQGKEFLAMSLHLLEEHDDFCKRASELGAPRDVTLRIGIPSVLGTFFLMRIVPEFELRNPGIHLNIEEVPTITGIKRIDDSTLDLIIGIMDNTYANCDSALVFQTELQAAVGKHHPLASKACIDGSMLERYPFLIISNGSYHYNAILERYKDKLNIIMQANQVSTIKFMLENSKAVTIIYKELFASDENIVTIPLADPIPANVNVLWRKNSYLTKPMKTFIQYLKEIAIS